MDNAIGIGATIVARVSRELSLDSSKVLKIILPEQWVRSTQTSVVRCFWVHDEIVGEGLGGEAEGVVASGVGVCAMFPELIEALAQENGAEIENPRGAGL